MRLLAIMIAINCAVLSCDGASVVSQSNWGDLSPPVLTEDQVDSSGIVDLTFDEDVSINQSNVSASGGLEPQVKEQKGPRVKIDASKGAKVGKSYALKLRADDKAGNSTTLLLPYYPPNPRLPKVIINEIATKISTKNRDAVELRVMEDGNLNGMTFFVGTRDNSDGLFVFGDIEVHAGDFIVVHCKAEGMPVEKNESTDWAESGGKNALPTALDVWVSGSPGLPDTSGVVTLTQNPIGPIMDALLYSDKVAEKGATYDGFGTKKLLDRVTVLAKEAAWSFESKTPDPADAADSTSITATRSLSRQSSGTDTNAKSDWHLVPTNGATLGSANSDATYAP